MPFSADFVLSLVALGAALGLAVFANWKAGQPWDDLKPKRVPWRGILILSGFAAFLMVVHLINLAGLETGPEHSPFGRF